MGDAGLSVKDAEAVKSSSISHQLTLLIEAPDDANKSEHDQLARKNRRDIESKLLLQTIANIQGRLANERHSEMHDLLYEFCQKTRQLVVFVMNMIQDPKFFQTAHKAAETKRNIIHEFEDFVFLYDSKKVHKLAFHAILRTSGQIFIELDNYRDAIMTFKALENLCRQWQLENRYHTKTKKLQGPLTAGTEGFYPHLMSVYC